MRKKKTTTLSCKCGNELFNLDDPEDYRILTDFLDHYNEKIISNHRSENTESENYLFKKIKQAIIKNVLIFDTDSPGTMTTKLIDLMSSNIIINKADNKDGRLSTVYVPESGYFDLLYYDNVERISLDTLIYRGIQVIKTWFLDNLESNKKRVVVCKGAKKTITRRNAFDYFNYLGASVQCSDSALVLGVCNNGEPIVGSY